MEDSARAADRAAVPGPDGEIGRQGRLYLTRRFWLPQRPLEDFNLWMSDRIVRRLPRLPLQGDAALAQYPALRVLRQEHAAIKDELARALAFKDDIPTLDKIHPRDYQIASRGWRTFVLRLWGDDVPVNAAACPRTLAAIDRIPGAHSAVFSLLDGGAAIPEHRGWAAGVVRCHYPLIVPERAEECFIAIEDRPYAWCEGEPLLFDDTRRHRVDNRTPQFRVLLIVDFEPAIPFPYSVYCRGRYALVRRSAEMGRLRARAAVAAARR